MKESRFNSLTTQITNRIQSVAGRISDEYKKELPFNQEKVEPIDKVYIYDKLTTLERNNLVLKYGLEAWTAFEKDVNASRRARGMYA
jgi:hypothetical protein